MKRFSIVGVSAIALLSASAFIGASPSVANVWHTPTAIAQNVLPKAKIDLSLTAQKQIVQKDTQGKQKITWQPLQGRVTVMPKDVIRYTITGANNSDREVNNLVVTQPIPQRTAYVLNSVTVNHPGAIVTYSINNVKTFVEKPIIRVKLANGKVETQPAPAEMYTHVRWKFAQAINPKTAVNAAYLVRVK